MEALLGWTIILGIWAFYELTTKDQRDRWMWNVITAWLVAGGVGFLWHLAQ